MLRNGFAIITALFLSAPLLAAPVDADVTFTANVTNPLHDFAFEGKGATAQGDDTGAITVKLADLKTGMDGRDDHMRKVLKIATWPTAKLMVKTKDAKSFTGDLTLHGVTKPVSGKVDGKVALFDIKLSDFGITQAEVALPAMKLQVQDIVSVKVEAK